MPKPKPGLNTPSTPNYCNVCGKGFTTADRNTVGGIVPNGTGLAHAKCLTKQGAPKVAQTGEPGGRGR